MPVLDYFRVCFRPEFIRLFRVVVVVVVVVLNRFIVISNRS
jgi:hypothetical protein